MKKIFKDIRVIELAGVLAGPSVGYFFAELGATVIKIENPKTNGDVTRSWKLRTEDPSSAESAYYWSVNALKEIVFLDLSLPLQRNKFHDLVKGADIVISNFKKGDDKRYGADHSTLKKLNPRIISASINGFGEDSSRTAYDLILQAESGFMFMNGEKGSNPVKMPVALIDLLAAHQLKEAVLIALFQRERTGKGCKTTVSLFDSAVASLANQATNWLIASHLPQSTGSLHPNIAPYGELFETADKQLITFAIGSNRQFRSLCRILGYEKLASENRFSSNQLRVSNRMELYGILANYIGKLTFRTLFDKCTVHDIPVGKIRNLKEVFALPEAEKMLLQFTHRGKKLRAVKSIAFKISEK